MEENKEKLNKLINHSKGIISLIESGIGIPFNLHPKIKIILNTTKEVLNEIND